jgi:hypothetical protein
MISAPPFQLTNDSITVIWQGKPVIVKRDQPQFVNLRRAIMEENWDEIAGHLTFSQSLKIWAKGKFAFDDDKKTFSYEGQELPTSLNARIIAMASTGQDPSSFFNFWEKLQRNPSFRSVEQVWPFLAQKGIPLTKDGNFRAYKSVKRDFTDHHTGTVDNEPGTVNEMPRNKISDDPNEACHYGFHVGALEYAKSFGSEDRRIIICEVDPADVVCVPYDYSHQKMRVCKYTVIGLYNGEHMSSTVEEEVPVAVSENDEAEYIGEDYYEEQDYDPYEDSFAEDCSECYASIPPTETFENHWHEAWCTNYRMPPVSGAEQQLPVIPVKTPEKKEKPHLRRDGEATAKNKKKAKKMSMKKIFEKLDNAGPRELMEQSIDVLRKYASNKLKIVGASKLGGGKTALVNKIVETR